jgi:quercetin dioxygenase-like cupin family protein
MKYKIFPRFKKGIFLVMPIIWTFIIPVDKPINSSVYDWNKLPVKENSTGSVRNILKGPTRALDMLEVKAITLKGKKALKEYTVEKGFDELLILKKGSAIITVGGESKQLSEGSVVVAAQGDRVSVKNPDEGEMTFYSFMFKPGPGKTNTTHPVAKNFHPVFKEWNTLVFNNNENGGRRDVMKEPTSTLKELEIHVTTLKEGVNSHAPHTHPDEEVILMRYGNVDGTINGTHYQAGPGSFFFVTNDDYHGVGNIGNGPCEYYAFRWLTY